MSSIAFFARFFLANIFNLSGQKREYETRRQSGENQSGTTSITKEDWSGIRRFFDLPNQNSSQSRLLKR